MNKFKMFKCLSFLVFSYYFFLVFSIRSELYFSISSYIEIFWIILLGLLTILNFYAVAIVLKVALYNEGIKDPYLLAQIGLADIEDYTE